jgi:hypothetical protein
LQRHQVQEADNFQVSKNEEFPIQGFPHAPYGPPDTPSTP